MFECLGVMWIAFDYLAREIDRAGSVARVVRCQGRREQYLRFSVVG